MAEWTPFPTHCYSENLATSGIEPGTSGVADRNSDNYTTEAVLHREHQCEIDNKDVESLLP
jgi:hypothetical protein